VERLPASIKNPLLCQEKEETQKMTVKKTNLLKVDKDCHIPAHWMWGLVRTIRQICEGHSIKVLEIKTCPSRRKGLHFYVTIRPAIDARFANYLQWLIGDDCQRVDFNRTRIDSDLMDWNKLFEEPEVRLRTICRSLNTNCGRRPSCRRSWH